MPEYMTKEAIGEAIENGDIDIMNKLLSNEIAVGEEVEVEETEEVEEIAEEAIPTEIKENTEEVVEQIVEQKVEDNEYVKEMEALRDKQQAELTRLREETNGFKAELEKAKVNANRELIEKERTEREYREKLSETQKVEIVEDQDDIELAGTYSKNNRTLIEDIKSSISDNVTKSEYDSLLDKLNKLSLAEDERQKQIEKNTAANAEKEKQSKMFSEVNSFQEKNGHFKLNTDIKNLYSEHNAFRDRVSEFIHSEDSSEINKAVHGIIDGESDRYKSMRENVSKAGIEIPNDAKTYLELSEIVDLKNGYKYNKYTGEYETITDDYGNQVCQRSLDDAFKLSTYSDRVNEARRDQSTEIQKRLDTRENSAVTLSPEQISNGDESNNLSEQDMRTILNMSSDVIKKNPELMRQLELVNKRLGIK